MPNPFASFSGGNLTGPMGNIQQMIQSFNYFKSNFTGDPKQKVMEMLQNGSITQDQLNAAQQMARQLQQFLPK